MKTAEPPVLQADLVISEVRRIKTALAAKHDFDVAAMVRSLQERERQVKFGKLGESPLASVGKSEVSDA